MTTPELVTPRLLLRAFERADAADVFAYAVDPDVARYTTWTPHRSIDDSHAFIDMVLHRDRRQFTWAIRRPDASGVAGPVIGVIEFGPCDAEEARFDYVLAKPHWGQGLMTEAARAVIGWGLAHCPRVMTVVSNAMTANVGSQRVMEKCGLTFEGTRMHQWAKSASPVKLRHYRATRAAILEASAGW